MPSSSGWSARQGLELLDDLGRATEPEVGIDAAQQRCKLKRLEAKLLGADEPFAVETVEGLPSPEPEGRGEQPPGIRHVAGAQRLPSEAAQALEPGDVERAAGDVEHVPRRSRAQGRGCRLERRPELADIAVDDGRCGGRRLVAPDGIDQALGRDDLARVEQQECEQGSLLGSAEGLSAVAVADLQVAQQPEFCSGSVGCAPAVTRIGQRDGSGGIHGRRTPLHPLDAATGPPPSAGVTPGVGRIVRRFVNSSSLLRACRPASRT